MNSRFPVVFVKHAGVVGEMGLENSERAVRFVISDAKPHAGLLGAILAEGDAALQAFFGERAVVAIAEVKAGGGIAGHVDVRPAVVIKIGCGHGESIGAARVDTGSFADVGEAAVAVVVKQPAAARGKSARAADHGDSFPIAAGGHFRAWVEVDVGAEEKIQMAVAIIVHKGASGAPLGHGQNQARLAGDIGERAVAVVAEQHVPVPIGEKKIVEPVVVVVADGDARHPARPRKAGFRGHIGERTVAIVPVQAIAGARWCGAEARAPQDQDVEPAVVIVVEKSDTATVGFENAPLGIDTAVNAGRRQAGLVRDIGELRVERQPGALSSRLRPDTARSHALPKKTRRQCLKNGPSGNPARHFRQAFRRAMIAR